MESYHSENTTHKFENSLRADYCYWGPILTKSVGEIGTFPMKHTIKIIHNWCSYIIIVSPMSSILDLYRVYVARNYLLC